MAADLTRVWLIEVWSSDELRWEVSQYAAVVKRDAVTVLDDYRRVYPMRKFRVRRYTRAD